MNEDVLDRLIHRLFEGELSPEDKAELNTLLLTSAEARKRYVQAAAVHAALCRWASSVESSLPGQSGALSAAPARPRSAARFAWLVLAASLILGAGGLLWNFTRPAAIGLATVVEAREIVWKEGSSPPVAGGIRAHEPVEFLRGCLRLVYPTGATVTLEGPCLFVVEAREAITVSHGRVSVHAPPGAQGFVVDTPGGRFVDLGTEFGLAVGSDGQTPVVLTEVFKGEVEVQATGIPTRLLKGDSRALVQDQGLPMLVDSLDEAPIRLANHALDLPVTTRPEEAANLALGKPVSSPGHYARKHGSVFPPDRLTDGRINDSGVPGDWSFWLAPNEQDGEFTVDLLQPETVGRVALQNTNNRGIGDRGVASFEVYGSLDNQKYFLLTRGDMPRITGRKGEAFPFHDFRFPPAQMRYLKLVVTGHYRHPDRPPQRTDHSGGLNEIRLFAQ